MAAMKTPPQRVRQALLPLSTLLLLLAFLSAYFFYHVPRQREFFTKRNYRLLGLMRSQIMAKTASFRVVLKNAAANTDPAEPEKVRAYLQSLVVDLEHVGSVPGGGEPSDSLEIKLDSGAYWMYFRHRNGVHELTARMDVAKLVTPLIRSGVFDDVLLAKPNGQVVFQHSQSGQRLDDLAALFGAAKKEAAVPNLVNSANVEESQLAQTTYQAYFQRAPIPFEPPDGEKAAVTPGGYQLTLCALVRRTRFLQESMQLSYHVMALILLLLLLPVVSWPCARMFRGGDERFWPSDGVLVTLSAWGTVSLLSLLLFGLYTRWALDSQANRQLETLADQIASRFSTEVRALYGQLRRFEQTAAFQETVMASEVARSEGHPAPCASGRLAVCAGNILNRRDLYDQSADLYPFFDDAAWADSDGQQRIKWTPRAKPSRLVAVGFREYFKAARDGPLLTLKHPPGEEPVKLALEPVYGINTGANVLVLAAPSDAKPSWVGTITARPMSVIRPVLPPGLGFAIVRSSDGQVVFHSDESRNLNEKFFEECDEDRALRSLVQGGGRGLVAARYQGTPHALFVRPLERIEHLPWVLITFRDKTTVSTLNVEALTVGSMLLLLYGAIVAVVLVAGYWIYRRQPVADWIWPDEERAPVYRHLSAFYVVVAGLFLGWILVGAPPEILSGGFAVPLLAVLGSFLILRYAEQPPPWRSSLRWGLGTLLIPLFWEAQAEPSLRLLAKALAWRLALAAVIVSLVEPRIREGVRRSRRWWQPGYVSTAGLLLAMLSVLPCFAFVKAAYDREMELFIGYARRHFTAALEERALRVMKLQPQLLLEGNEPWWERRRALEPAKDDPLRGLDLYHSAFYEARISPPNAEQAPPPPRSPAGVILDKLRPHYNDFAMATSAAIYGAQDRDGGRIEPRTPALNPFGSFAGWVCAALICVLVVEFTRRLLPRVFLFALKPPGPRAACACWPAPASRNLLVLAPPVPRLAQPFQPASDAHLIDVAAVAVSGNWLGAASSAALSGKQVVALDRLEHDPDNRWCNEQKLLLIERLLYLEKKTVHLFSTIDPASFSDGRRGDDAVQPGAAASGSNGRRWPAALSTFWKVEFDDAPDPNFSWPPLPGDLRDWLEAECSATASLQAIGHEVGLALSTAGPALTEADVGNRVLERAGPYYAQLWSRCSRSERLALIHLAEGGLANPRSAASLQQLLKKRLIRRDPQFRVMNESFRSFVRSASPYGEVSAWVQEAAGPRWNPLKTSYATVLLMGLAFLALTQREVLESWIPYVTGLAGAAATVNRVLGAWNRGSGSPSDGSLG